MVTNDKSIRVDVPPGETLGPGSPLMKPYEISWDAKRQYAIDAGQIADRVMSSALSRLSTRARGLRPGGLEHHELAAHLDGSL